jgi:2,4-dienoyl-CoA reductase-like NADH-dependent reductase (Old Yellow Enzyme family)/thioredoxin reductase
MNHYPHLFNPIQIGDMTAPNRLLMSAMSINFGVDEKGHVTEQLTGYFAERAKGGAGMMLVGGGAVHPTGLELPDLPALWNDDCVPALRRMVDAVRPYGAKFGVQLMHGGRQSYHENKVAPSAVAAPAVVKGIPRALTLEEIDELIDAFGDAARRCRESGFDFIEIHGAHGYLVNQFLAPNANLRRDQYGGSFANRTRFLYELLDSIYLKAGADFPVGIRINGEDYIDNGWGLEETLKLAGILEQKGVAFLHVSAGVYGSRQLTIPSMYVKQGCFIHLAEAVKSAVSIPVIAVGRIKDPDLADRIIREGKADAVAMGRALLADPALPRKARDGKPAQIRPCIGCCLGCIHAVLALEPGGCVVNPEVGREYLLKDKKRAAKGRRVLVAGAGPSGLAAARMAALRGHHVTVCEESSRPGGLIRLAAKAPGRTEVSEIVDFLTIELERLKVEMYLNHPISTDLLDRLKPDAVILATGSRPDMPIIKGLFKTTLHLCTVTDAMDGQTPVGGSVIIIGGGQAGLLLADLLAEQGKIVAVLNRRPHFAEEMSSNDRFYLRERLKRETVTLYKRVTGLSVDSDSVSFKSDCHKEKLTGCDTIIIAEAMAAVRDAGNLLKGFRGDVQFIGDAKTPRDLMVCMSEAEELGRSL